MQQPAGRPRTPTRRVPMWFCYRLKVDDARRTTGGTSPKHATVPKGSILKTSQVFVGCHHWLIGRSHKRVHCTVRRAGANTNIVIGSTVLAFARANASGLDRLGPLRRWNIALLCGMLIDSLDCAHPKGGMNETHHFNGGRVVRAQHCRNRFVRAGTKPVE